MIKRIIFDVDNTLLDWKEEYFNSLNITLDKLNYTYDFNLIMNIRESIKNYEKDCIIYNREAMLEEINNGLEIKLPYNFIDLWLEELGKCAELASEKLIETFAYLSSKYELVTFSNWFNYSQVKRLEKANLLKYFKNTYGADMFPKKPYKEGYIEVIGDHSFEECMLIGDNLEQDVEAPIKLGMKAIYYNRDNQEKSHGYQTVYHLEDLMKVL